MAGKTDKRIIAHVQHRRDGINEYNSPLYIQQPTKVQHSTPQPRGKDYRDHRNDLKLINSIFKQLGVKL